MLVTVGDRREAVSIAHALLSSRLAACVNVLPGVQSIYRWKGKIEKSHETLLLIKTTAKHLPAVEKTVRRHHSYEVPEIVSIRLDRGSKPYLEWLFEQTRRS